MRTILRRAAANKRGRVDEIATMILWFNTMIPFEGIHPLEAFDPAEVSARPASRASDRQPVRVLSALRDANGAQGFRLLAGVLANQRIRAEVEAAPDRCTYTDVAVASAQEDEFEALDLYPSDARRRGRARTPAACGYHPRQRVFSHTAQA